MNITPAAFGRALAAAFGLGALFGACATAATGLAGFGAWLLLHRDDHNEPEGVEPPAWHPDHPAVYRDDTAWRHFEDMRIRLDARRRALRREW